MSKFGVPKDYRKSPQKLVSYDFTDLLTGRAYKTYYGGRTAQGYFATTQAQNSDFENLTTISTQFTSGGNAKRIDIDFDITFDIPQTIEGDLIINGTVGSVSPDSGKAKENLVVQALKNGVHVASAATLHVFVGDNQVNTPASNEHAVILTMPKTRFNKGDVLKLTHEVWAQETAGGKNSKVSLAHDGGNRNDDNDATDKTIEDDDSTILKWDIPFNTR
jgi:hypothetical protein